MDNKENDIASEFKFGSSEKREAGGYGYAPYDDTDDVYYGAKATIDYEWEMCVKKRPFHPNSTESATDEERRGNLAGLALSGGGIRSASFSLGIMQALAKVGWLKQFDYLSTVSGGGYIGSSLTWLLHKTWKVPADAKTPCPDEIISQQQTANVSSQQDKSTSQTKTCSVSYGVDWNNFPFGTYPIAESEPKKNDIYKGRILRYIRQHARYLTPGGGIDWVSLTAVVLRNSLFSFLVYGAMIVFFFFILNILSDPLSSLISWLNLSKPPKFQLIPSPCVLGEYKSCFSPTSPASTSPNLITILNVAGYIMVIWAIISLLYALMTSCFGKDWFFGGGKRTNYSWRYLYEKSWGRWPLIAALIFAVLGSVPATYQWLYHQGTTPAPKGFTITGTPTSTNTWEIKGTIKAPEITPPTGTKQNTTDTEQNTGSFWQTLLDNLALKTGIFSTLVGLASTLFAFKKTSATKRGKIPMGLVVSVASFTLIFGILLLAYHVYFWSGWHIISGHPYWSFASIFITVGLLARFTNINYMSVHRYYRDRLMETFMPNVCDAVDVNGTLPGYARLLDSDGAKLYEMRPRCNEGRKEHESINHDNECVMGPYHIINTNIVLVSSNIPKFRARGGDNFVLTPLHCGSNATGWCQTGDTINNKNSPYESMSFATAMAVSGSAVNPNTGGGGEGITRHPILSFLMGIFNIRRILGA